MIMNCPCCGREMSGRVEQCPECGFAYAQYINEQNEDIKAILLATGKEAYAKNKRIKEQREREEEEARRKEEEELRRETEARQNWTRTDRTGGALKVSPLEWWKDFNAFKVLITQNLVSGIWMLSLVLIVIVVISLDKPETEARVLIGLGVALAVRVILEFVVVLFSIANSLHEIKEELCQGREKKDAAK